MKADRGGLILEGIPIPPTSNHQYRSFTRYGKIVHVPSPELLYFRKSFAIWASDNAKGLDVARAMAQDTGLEVEAFMGFTRERLFTKKGTFKRFDVSNRLKALHDELADALQIDDSAFFSISAEKIEVPSALQEQVIIRLSPFIPRVWQDVQNLIL